MYASQNMIDELRMCLWYAVAPTITCKDGNAKVKTKPKHKKHKTNAPEPKSRKLRLLALHGYSSDAKRFRAKMGAVRSHLKGIASLEFLDAPHCVPPCAHSRSQLLEPGRGWWCPVDARGKAVTRKQLQAEWHQSVAAVAHKLHECARDGVPIDGLLAFSQGGAVALAATAVARNTALAAGAAPTASASAAPRFCVLFSGFDPSPSMSGTQTAASSAVTLLPPTYMSGVGLDTGLHSISDSGGVNGLSGLATLHCWGSADAIVPPQHSRALYEMCVAATGATASTFEHSGGHVVPSAVRGQVKAFVAEQAQAILHCTHHD